MTEREFRSLKDGDRVAHIMHPNRIEVVEGNETENGFFIRESGSKGGWNTITESSYKYYDVIRDTKGSNTSTVKEALENAITWKMSGKLSGFSSLSTSPLCNAHCLERMAKGTTVCKHCFSARMQKRYKNLRVKLERNTELLTKTELKPEDIPFLNMAFFRFESFGDLNNTLQVKNYFLIAEQNPHCTMALWTKNPWIIADAMEEYGIRKPENLIIILSSVQLNMSADAEIVGKKYPFIDKVFTVYDKERAESVSINCGARSCAECQRCYHKTNDIEYINELLK